MIEKTASLEVACKDLKMLRELLCRVQTNLTYPNHYNFELLHVLCNEIDKHRPLGTDGKHGNLHTDTCGCEG